MFKNNDDSNKQVIKKQQYSKVFKYILVSIFLFGYIANTSFVHAATEFDERIDLLLSYEPFKNRPNIARLGYDASVKFTNNLPRIDCATAFYPMVAAFIEATYPEGDYRYSKQNIFTSTTSRQAFFRLTEGNVDMVFAFAPSKEQLDFAEQKGIKLKLTPIGKEAFVFFVNEFNPIDNLTIEQIQGIYGGKITNWQEVGGLDEEIKAYQRQRNSGSQTALERLMDGKDIMLPPQDELLVHSMMLIVDLTSDYKNSKNALGYSFRYFATKMANSDNIRLLKIAGVTPDALTIESGDYKLTEQFYVITVEGRNKNPNINKLIEWILSDEGQKLIEKTGYAKK